MTEAQVAPVPARVRPQDWASGVSLAAGVGGAWSLLRGRWRRARRLAVVALAADLAGRWLSRRNPGPFQARFRFALVHPAADRARLLESLTPRPGERILEIGPGAGHHAVDVATTVAPDGSVAVLDIQADMLDAVTERAARVAVTNVHPEVGDACARLPYDDGAFDAAYLVSVLGELPDKPVTLRELRRVTRDGARLVVGEIVFDPDFVSLGRLRRLADAAGFEFERRFGSPLAYYARFRAR